MDEKTKDPAFLDTFPDPEPTEPLNSANSTDPVKLFSVLASDLLTVNSDYICIASSNTLKVFKNSVEEFKLFTFKTLIQAAELSKTSDSVFIVLENLGFTILDLETEQEQEILKSCPILTFKWNNWADQIGIFTAEDNLEVFTRPTLTQSIKVQLREMVCFEFNSANSLVFQDTDLKCKVLNFIDGSSAIVENCKEEELEKIVVLDQDRFALQYKDSILVLSCTNGLLFNLGHKQIFEYDVKSDYVYLNNPGSLQVLIISKENFISQKYQDCVAYFTLMESCSQIVIRKKNDRPQVVARHGDDVFFYTFKTETQTEEPLPEIKESPNKSFVNSKKTEKKQKVINPKEIISPIVNVLNKNLEECVRKVEKNVVPSTFSNLVTKTIQGTLEQKLDASAQKNLVQSTLTQALRYEFQNSLIPVIQQQLNENFNKISVLFQESLKASSDFNNRSAAKTASLEAHMKNAIENISTTTNKLEKEYLAQLKRINESEIKLNESFDTRKQEELIVPKSINVKLDAFKKEIDSKLKNLDFEGAISAVLREKNPGYLFKVLEVINPKSLCSSRIIREPLLKQLFYELIDNIDHDSEFKDFYTWTEEIVKNMNLKEEATQLIVKLFNISEKKPKIREIIRIITMKIG